MSEETKNEVEVKENANLSAMSNENFDKLFERNERALNLSAEYLEFEKVGSKKTLVFLNISSIEKVEEDTGEVTNYNIATFADKERNTFVAQQTQIVQACRMLNNFDTVEITFKGKKDLGGGKKVHKFDVVKLV